MCRLTSKGSLSGNFCPQLSKLLSIFFCLDCFLQKGQSIGSPGSYARRDAQSSPFHFGHSRMVLEEKLQLGQRLCELCVKLAHAKCSMGPHAHFGHWWVFASERDKYIARISLAWVALALMMLSTHCLQRSWPQHLMCTKLRKGCMSVHMEHSFSGGMFMHSPRQEQRALTQARRVLTQA